ncbi:MAG: phage tail tube protein [Candidatus Dormibacteria bacterium]
MPNPVIAYPGGLSAVGVGKEATFGTIQIPSVFAPATESAIEPDPGIFYPEVMTGLRDLNIYALQGQVKVAGNIAGPMYPSSGAPLFIGALGTDNCQSGTAPGVNKNGTLAAAAANATTLTYTLVAGVAPVANDYLQIGPALTTYGAAALIPGVSQVIKITSVTGAGPYTLTVPPIPYAVGASAIAQNVQAPFFHNAGYQNTLPSFTIEKNTGGFESIQYRGCRVNKFSLKLDTTNKAAEYTADMIGQSFTVLPTPTAITIDQSSPWVFAEASVSLYGQLASQIDSIQVDIDNGLKDIFTFNQAHFLNFLLAASFKVSGQATAVWTSFDDPNWGYFNTAVGAVQGALSLTLTHGAGGKETMSITIPQVNLTKYKDVLKTKDAIMTNLSFEGSYQFSSSSRITASLSTQQNTPY